MFRLILSQKYSAINTYFLKRHQTQYIVDIDPSLVKVTGYRNDYNVTALVDVNNATCQSDHPRLRRTLPPRGRVAVSPRPPHSDRRAGRGRVSRLPGDDGVLGERPVCHDPLQQQPFLLRQSAREMCLRVRLQRHQVSSLGSRHVECSDRAARVV